MKSALPPAVALGALMFSAAGSQAYGPGPGAISADARPVIKVHGTHRDCRLGKVMGKPNALWHGHPPFGGSTMTMGFMHTPCTPPPPTKKIPKMGAGDQNKQPIVAPRCSAKPSAGPNCPSHSAQWTCASWYSPLKCCTKWQCTSKIR